MQYLEVAVGGLALVLCAIWLASVLLSGLVMFT